MTEANKINLADPKILIAAGGVLAIVVIAAIFFFRNADQSATDIASSGENAPPGITENAAAHDKSIAVLPFANRSPDPDDAFFAEGVHDDLLTQLSKIGDMRVISRTSVMGYTGPDLKIPQIASELGVAVIMEGAVQRAGNRVRINVQLIDGQSDEHIWAEIYDRELTAGNVFEIQSEITHAIANALKSVLTLDDQAQLAQRPTQSLAAYDAYLRGVAELSSPEASVERAIRSQAAFEAAIAEDENFAGAHAGLARSMLIHFWYGRNDDALLQSARASLERAQALAPESVETLITWGYFYYFGYLDYDRAGEFIDRALTKAPSNASVWELKGYVARRAGRFEESLRALNKAIDLNPRGETPIISLGSTLGLLGRYDEARAVVERTYSIGRKNREAYLADMAWNWILEGEVERGCEILKEGADPNAEYYGYFYWTDINCAYYSRDVRRLERLFTNIPAAARNIQPNYPEIEPITRAYMLGALGRRDEARRIAQTVAERLNKSDDPYPLGWSQTAGYLPTDVPALLGDIDGFNAAMRDFEEDKPADAYANAEFYFWAACLFAFVGDIDAVFDSLDLSMTATGPGRFPQISISPVFDVIRDDPRYADLKGEYEAWAAKNNETNE